VRDVKQKPWPRWPVFDAEDESAVVDVVRSGQWWYVGGSNGTALEREFAEFQHARYGVTCTNGSHALEIALRALGVVPGDEVIVPAYTFIATATAVLLVGAIPVFADIEGDTLNIDPDSVESLISDKTRCIVAVHMAGRPADLDRLREIASKHGLRLLEDAAQAHAAAWRGTRVGAIGDAGTFSLQASKNLTAGEGGIIVSNDQAVADGAWSVMNVGRSRGGGWYEHNLLGSNYRMTEFQSALARVQLRRVEEQTLRREASASRLRSLLVDVSGITLPSRDDRITTHANHLFTFRYNPGEFGGMRYGEFIKALNAEGVPCSDGYLPLYKGRPFANSVSSAGPAASQYLPVCEQVCVDTVWITQNLLLADPEEMDDIAEAIRRIQTVARR
jgi:dTDP-4-amino-4,6-dideoxygalactose transaminase